MLLYLIVSLDIHSMQSYKANHFCIGFQPKKNCAGGPQKTREANLKEIVVILICSLFFYLLPFRSYINFKQTDTHTYIHTDTLDYNIDKPIYFRQTNLFIIRDMQIY